MTDINDVDRSILLSTTSFDDFILPAQMTRISSSAFPPETCMTLAVSRRIQLDPTSPPRLNKKLKLHKRASGSELLVVPLPLFDLLEKKLCSSAPSPFNLKPRQRFNFQQPSLRVAPIGRDCMIFD